MSCLQTFAGRFGSSLDLDLAEVSHIVPLLPQQKFSLKQGFKDSFKTKRKKEKHPHCRAAQLLRCQRISIPGGAGNVFSPRLERLQGSANC